MITFLAVVGSVAFITLVFLFRYLATRWLGSYRKDFTLWNKNTQHKDGFTTPEDSEI